MLEVIDYKKNYAGHAVLNVSSLQLQPGVYWIRGENGSGKTTFLKSVAGLIPFEGTIRWNKIDLRKQRTAYVKRVSWAEAEPLYPSFLTGNDLIRFYCSTKGGTKEMRERFTRRLGVDAYCVDKLQTYSSGMIKKLSLVLSFLGNPELILLDEPFITLDEEAITQLSRLISELSAKGVAFCISSHQELKLNLPYIILHVHSKTIERQ